MVKVNCELADVLEARSRLLLPFADASNKRDNTCHSFYSNNRDIINKYSSHQSQAPSATCAAVSTDT
eukprot:scaffold823_cov86-Cylindrotheca_fusiformis.AAC.2